MDISQPSPHLTTLDYTEPSQPPVSPFSPFIQPFSPFPPVGSPALNSHLSCSNHIVRFYAHHLLLSTSPDLPVTYIQSLIFSFSLSQFSISKTPAHHNHLSLPQQPPPLFLLLLPSSPAIYPSFSPCLSHHSRPVCSPAHLFLTLCCLRANIHPRSGRADAALFFISSSYLASLCALLMQVFLILIPTLPGSFRNTKDRPLSSLLILLFYPNKTTIRIIVDTIFGGMTDH